MTSSRSFASEGSFTIQADAGEKVITVVGKGFWSLPMLGSHFDELGRIIERRRDSGAKIRVLVDLRDAAVQASSVMVRVNERTSQLYVDGDHVAIVVQSTLAKLQMRRSVASGLHEVFITMEAARRWLSQVD